MIDQIKNKILSTTKNATADAQNERKIQKPSSVVSEASSNQQTKNVSKNITAFVSKDVIKDMAKDPPIDKVNVSRIKNAISNGSYPIDLEKISDALLSAYKELEK